VSVPASRRSRRLLIRLGGVGCVGVLAAFVRLVGVFAGALLAPLGVLARPVLAPARVLGGLPCRDRLVRRRPVRLRLRQLRRQLRYDAITRRHHQLGRHRDLLALAGDADAIVGVDHRGGADQAVTAAQHCVQTSPWALQDGGWSWLAAFVDPRFSASSAPEAATRQRREVRTDSARAM
jgi:hypothetical protein